MRKKQASAFNKWVTGKSPRFTLKKTTTLPQERTCWKQTAFLSYNNRFSNFISPDMKFSDSQNKGNMLHGFWMRNRKILNGKPQLQSYGPYQQCNGPDQDPLKMLYFKLIGWHVSGSSGRQTAVWSLEWISLSPILLLSPIKIKAGNGWCSFGIYIYARTHDIASETDYWTNFSVYKLGLWCTMMFNQHYMFLREYFRILPVPLSVI